MNKTIKVIEVPSGIGAKLTACEKGPKRIYKHPSITLYPNKTLDTPLDIINELNTRVSESVSQTQKEGYFPLVIGGDHSVAVGTWGSGIAKSLLWIDAHMDAHNFETSPSKAYHGMPVRALLEKGHILHSKSHIKPENLCLIGIRSYEPEEFAFLKNLNVRIYFIEEVKERGLKAVLQEAIARVSKNGFGISLDIDAIDPLDAPGVGSPEPHGITSEELLMCLPLFHHEKLVALELVEYNPERDVGKKTLNLCSKIIEDLFS